MNGVYEPPPRRYRRRYFSPFGWCVVVFLSFVVVVYVIGLTWLFAALK